MIQENVANRNWGRCLPLRRRTALMLLAIAGAATHAAAEPRTQYTVQLSRDGTNWSSQLDLTGEASGTARVFSRILVSYVQQDGPVPRFITAAHFQPTVERWDDATDTILPFESRSRVIASYGATPVLGRTFGGVTAGTSNAIVAHRNDIGGQTVLRFASTGITNAIGSGSGSNNVTGSRGVYCSNDPISPRLGLTNLELFVWGFEIDIGSDFRLMTFDVPIGGLRQFGPNESPPDLRRGSEWTIRTSPYAVVRAPALPTLFATLMVPAPAAGAVIGILGVYGATRRTRPGRERA